MANKYPENQRARVTAEQYERIEKLSEQTGLSKASILRLGCDTLYLLHHLSVMDIANLISEDGQLDESVRELTNNSAVPRGLETSQVTNNGDEFDYNSIGLHQEYLGIQPSDADFFDTNVVSERDRLPLFRQLLMTEIRENYSQDYFLDSTIVSFGVSWFGVTERTARKYVDRLAHMGGIHPHISMHPEFIGRVDEMRNDVSRYFREIGEKMDGEQLWFDIADAYQKKATTISALSGYVSSPEMGISNYGNSIHGQWCSTEPRYYFSEEDAIDASQKFINRQFSIAPSPLSVEIAGVEIEHRYSTHRILTQLLVAGIEMGALSAAGARSIMSDSGFAGFTESSIVPDEFW